MNLTLKRFRSDLYGVFGVLRDEQGIEVAKTLEHAYPVSGGFAPKVPPGVYICQRGQHQLHSMQTPFTTFEITGVPGHTNILFHCGNTQSDSEGCVLLGTELNALGIGESRVAFAHFLDVEKDVDTFQLTVS